jgi:hypothetical protein
MKRKTWMIGGLLLVVQGCWIARDDQGHTTVLGPELAPIAVGVAVYKEAQDVDLDLEFVVSQRCVRVTPLDSYRFTLKRLDGTPEFLVDQFVSTTRKQIQHPRLVPGRYEIRVFHQDQTKKMARKVFSIQEKNPMVLVDVPCLD